ncbi:lycopene cyclase [Nostocoides sp. F2B08]|uniref:lycopene cyclase family protein n=1 Tax=Nostocoides sp. F2B08 TaxID=2653936 RepID=UPI001263377D|nr:lycopene cyclase family protein [Tetrasphaera sp. F2B08]KAB7741442.1 lycopene cyclase [Tetrasphaera sp. F2B08]
MDTGSAFDLAVVGLGPAGRAVASRAAARGLSVLALDPRPEAVWSPTYGIWGDELNELPESVVRARVAGPELRARRRHTLHRDYLVLDNLALQQALPLDAVEVRRARLEDADLVDLLGSRPGQARVVVDARGARPEGHLPDDPAPAQTAYGIVVPAEDAAPALDGAAGLLMDWRTDWADEGDRRGTPTFLYAIPLGQGRVLLEETCLAAAPAMTIPELKRRLRRRLVSRGIRPAVVDAPLEREIVRIPMRGRGHGPAEGILAVGTAGRGGNLVTGYSVAHSLRHADELARAIGTGLRGEGRLPSEIDPTGPGDLLREMGLRALLRLDVDGTLELFEAFGRLPVQAQRDFMSRDSTAPAMASAMWGVFRRMPPRAKRALVAATLGPSRGRLSRSSARIPLEG